MKVVLFCGGQGMRLRDFSDALPKPMVPVGYRPIVWHLMKYYAHQGHREFILCLGHKADVVKDYFLKYNECLTNDFVLSNGGRDVKLLSSDIGNWQVTFADTGPNATIGQRLAMVKQHLGDDEYFLANYADGLSDVDMEPLIARLKREKKLAMFVSVRPAQTFHCVRTNEAGDVVGINDVVSDDLWVNGGFFVLHRDIFKYFDKTGDLVTHVFPKLIAEGQLITHKHDGFWACMDTFKEKQQLDDLIAKGNAPWEIWRKPPLASVGLVEKLVPASHIRLAVS